MATQTLDSQVKNVPSASRRGGRNRFVLLLLLPSLIMILAINIYPFITGFLYSLQDGTLLKSGSFVGLQNYVKLFARPDFHHALIFSATFALFSVIGSYVIGLALALLLNQDIPGRGFFRVALLVPWIIPSVVSIVSWRWMIADQRGLLNIILDAIGIGPIYFLSSARWATFSVIIIKIWRSFPFMMISCLAALQSIEQVLYEAANIDGANAWNSFRYVTMPHIKNMSIVLWILMTIWSVNDFDTPWLLTQGGPSKATENLILLSYRYTFTQNDVGIGSSVAFVTLIILMILAVTMLKRQSQPD